MCYRKKLHSGIFVQVLLPCINPLNAELNPICHLLALLGDHNIFHVSGLEVNMTAKCIYVSHLYSNVLQMFFLRYLVVSSSISFIFKRFLIAGALNAVSADKPLSNREVKYFPYVHPEFCIRILQ